MKRLQQVTLVLLGLFVIYCLVSIYMYQFRHPGYTDTERFLRIPNALRWE